ncbi:M20/M25/M40 family metallo-hydrolase [Candidatus Poseidoniaceae archaeon]|nr:M20/M25/M40 family metallo-hydrolase [Candidatus Poseidoniaceae archaeon]
MDESALSKHSVAELKDMLRSQGLAVSGNKSLLIQRLVSSEASTKGVWDERNDASAAKEATITSNLSLEDDDFESPLTFKQRMSTTVYGPLNLGGLVAIGLALLMVTATVFIIQPAWLGFERDYDYELIDFDQTQARNFAEDLVNLGHPDWEGRMSATTEEANTSQYISQKFQEMGYVAEINEFQVPMHHVNSEPSFQLCVQGLGGFSPCEGIGSFNSQVTTFQHRIDYVIQGFSGQSEYMFDQEIGITDLGNGTDEALWQSATGTIGYVRGDSSKVGNTELYSNAAINDLAGLISVNKNYQCGQIEGNDCVPIFKGTNYDSLVAANGGNLPTDIPFISMSKDAGEMFETMVINSTEPASIELIIDVTNDQERTIYVPCGTIQGRTSELVIAGGHHDTVYHGQGAVDDTSGTSSILEMARQIAEVVNETGTPDRTIRFCTWGGEEEGLWGSRAYVEQMQSSLRDNLRLYINLDMNHVDADFANRGNSLKLFTNNEEDYGHIVRITDLYKQERSEIADKYDIQFSLLDGAQGDDDQMPCNSDHCPFVYDLGGKNGRAVVCYGSGSWEYHTYLDTMDRFNEESLAISTTVYGTYMRLLAYDLSV